MSNLWKCLQGASLIVICGIILYGTLALADENVSYRLTAGDSILVIVVNHADFGGTVTVMDDGTVMLPVAGQCKLAGLTLAETIVVLRQAYIKRLNNPEIYVTLAAMHAAVDNIYVLGAVKSPGMYPLKAKMGVLELILAAEGLTQPPTDCLATLRHGTSKDRVPIALNELMSGQPAANIPLAAGDTINIEVRPTIPVFVTGEVEAAGVVQISQDGTITQALSRAHGVRGDAKQKQLLLIRGKDITTCTLSALYQQDTTVDLPLQSGDIIRVESAMITVHVAGEVVNPGDYSVKRDVSLAELLALAGNTTPASRLDGLTITHSDGKQQTMNVNVTTPDKISNFQDGDRIVVPSYLVNVLVTGGVKLPGQFRLPSRINASEVIALSGGPTDNAAMSTVRVIHLAGNIQTVDATRVNDPIGDLTLAEGDRIIVPFTTTSVAVIGNVRSPGYISIDPNNPFTASQAIIRAGGLNDRSVTKRITVSRTVNGVSKRITIKFDASLHVKQLTDDLYLQPGDVVLVPKSTWSLKELLGTFSLINVLFPL